MVLVLTIILLVIFVLGIGIFGVIGFLAIALPGLAVFGLLVRFLYEAAKQKKQASFVQEGTMEFVMAGGRCIRILENIKGWYYHASEDTDEDEVDADGKKTGKKVKLTHKTGVGKYHPETRNPDGTINTPAEWKVEDRLILVKEAIVIGKPDYKGEPEKWWGWFTREGWFKFVRMWLRKRWGFYWVSITYPVRHIHAFEVTKARINETYAEKPEAQNLSGWIEVDKEKDGSIKKFPVTHLLHQFPRPVIVPNVEFIDLFRANLGIVVNFRVVMPNIPVFTYEGKFFPQLESAVRAGIMDYVKKIQLVDFITKYKTGPASDFFAEVISQLNPDMIQNFGTEITSAWVGEIQTVADTGVTEAQQAKRLNELQGDALIMKNTKEGEARVIQARREAEAIKAIGDAQAGALQAKRLAVAGHEEILQEQIRTDGIIGFTGSVLSQGGAGAGVIAAVDVKKKKEDDEKDTGPVI